MKKIYLYFVLFALGYVMPAMSLLPPLVTPEPGDLIINEILYAPASSQQEFVELINRSARIINLCSVLFSDNRDVPVEICTGTVEILPDSFVVIARDSVALKQAFPIIKGRVHTPASWPALNNSGDSAKIYSAGRLIDEIAYLPSWGGKGVSLERKDPAGPPSSFNWNSSVAPQGATPGFENSIFAPDELPPAILLAEISEEDILTLVWNEPININALAPSNFRINNQSPLALVAISSTQTTMNFGFYIGAAEVTYSDIEDLTGNKTPQTNHPLAYVPRKSDLLINEIMYAPLADAFDDLPDQPEYVELVNVSGHLLSLRELSLAGMPDEHNIADTLRSSALFPVAPPQSYILMYAESQTSGTQRTILRDAFPLIDFDANSITLLPIDQSSLSLLNAGDRIAVNIAINAAIDTQSKELIDEVFYSPDWHHPLLAETRGIALERRTLQAASTLQSNWSSAVVASGGTPGLVNSIVNKVTETPSAGKLRLQPSAFSPDGDGVDDVLQIQFSSENASNVVGIKVFDINGRLVRTVVESAIAKQQEILFWDGYGDDGHVLPVGIYIVALEALDVQKGKVLFLKKAAVLALAQN